MLKDLQKKIERNTGFEPVTLRAAIERSTTELTARFSSLCTSNISREAVAASMDASSKVV